MTWSWDPTLYAGAAAHYTRGRVGYPAEVADLLTAELGLDGRGRLLDVGCGPGSLTLLLAPLFAETTGLDPDPGMLAEAARRVPQAAYVQMPAEDLPGDLGRYDVVTLAQSFHWMDRPLVSSLLAAMLVDSGALVHVSARTHQGEGDVPWPAIEELVQSYLGSLRRAGQGTLADPLTSEAEMSAYEAGCFLEAGLTGPTRLIVPGWTATRSTDEVVDGVLSLSYAAPHLFAERLDAFTADLRSLLLDTRPDGIFEERMREIRLDVWRPRARPGT